MSWMRQTHSSLQKPKLYLDAHDGFQHDGAGPLVGGLEGVHARQLECHLAAVHRMRCAIRQRHLDVLRSK